MMIYIRHRTIMTEKVKSCWHDMSQFWLFDAFNLVLCDAILIPFTSVMGRRNVDIYLRLTHKLNVFYDRLLCYSPSSGKKKKKKLLMKWKQKETQKRRLIKHYISGRWVTTEWRVYMYSWASVTGWDSQPFTLTCMHVWATCGLHNLLNWFLFCSETELRFKFI